MRLKRRTRDALALYYVHYIVNYSIDQAIGCLRACELWQLEELAFEGANRAHVHPDKLKACREVAR